VSGWPVVAASGLGLFALLFWGCRVLPRERWQFLASVPLRKNGGGEWHALNLTWYGFFSATACAIACGWYLLLATAGGADPAQAGAALVGILLFAGPSARWVARLVEKKRYTLTIAGAFCVGTVVAPLVIAGINVFARAFGLPRLPLVSVMSALMVSYVLGEGVGRRACLSFGCCYGRPLEKEDGLVARLAVVFTGGLKKAAYEGGYDGRPLLPVQAFTAFLYVGTALGATLLFGAGLHVAALAVSLVVSQGWRFLSERLRADHRGDTHGSATAYQWMVLATAVYAIAIVLGFGDDSAPPPDLARGLRVLWSPGALVLLQLVWIASFLRSGRSDVTGATVRFHLFRDRV